MTARSCLCELCILFSDVVEMDRESGSTIVSDHRATESGARIGLYSYLASMRFSQLDLAYTRSIYLINYRVCLRIGLVMFDYTVYACLCDSGYQ